MSVSVCGEMSRARAGLGVNVNGYLSIYLKSVSRPTT